MNSLVVKVSEWQDLPEKLSGYFVISMPAIDQTMFVGKAPDIKEHLRLYNSLLFGKVFDKFGVKVEIFTNPTPWMVGYLESKMGSHYSLDKYEPTPLGARGTDIT